MWEILIYNVLKSLEEWIKLNASLHILWLNGYNKAVYKSYNLLIVYSQY